MNRKMVSVIIALCCIVITMGHVSQVKAAEPNQLLDKENLGTFLDTYFAKSMESNHTPGAAVSVVKGTEELLTRAYGYADTEKKQLINAETSLFPACSVSKLFTATAVMQLYEQGKIDLDTDIQEYLPDVKIKNSYDKPITCAMLLTHSSGVDEQSELDGSSLDSDQIRSQSEYFKTHIPTVIYEPGTLSRYSNMGYNLLGYIVEQVSGESYEDYVQNHILKELGMTRSSVRTSSKSIVAGYQYDNGVYDKQKLAYQYTSGSSGVIATAKDMGNFMIMHLNQGSYQENDVLSARTESEMQNKQFANADVYEGMGFGWIRDRYRGHEIIKHEGALPGYAATMILLPDENVGIYVVVNSLSGIGFDFEDALLEYLYGDVKSDKNVIEEGEQQTGDISRYIGQYRSYDGIEKNSIMKLGLLFDDTDLDISKGDDGKLKAVLYNQKKEREETVLNDAGNGVFVREDGKGQIAFRIGVEDEKAEYAFTNVSHCTYERVSALESKSTLLVGLLSIAGLLVGFTYLVIYLIRKKWGSIFHRYAVLMLAGAGITVVTFILSFCVEIYMILSYNYQGIPLLKMLLILLLAGVCTMAAATIYGIILFIKKRIGIQHIIFIGVFGSIQILCTIVLYYFNFIGIHIY